MFVKNFFRLLYCCPRCKQLDNIEIFTDLELEFMNAVRMQCSCGFSHYVQPKNPQLMVTRWNSLGQEDVKLWENAQKEKL